jgi:hypothetical protein
MLTLEYRHKSKEKAKSFIENLKNKLDLEKLSPPPNPLPCKEGEQEYFKNIEIMLVPNPNKRYNQFYYRIIIK